jgi:hypothetical protein
MASESAETPATMSAELTAASSQKPLMVAVGYTAPAPERPPPVGGGLQTS